MNVKREVSFIVLLNLVVGMIFWFPSYLDTDSKQNINLQLQVIANYIILALSVIPYYLLLFHYRRPKTIWHIVRIHLITCPMYILSWLILGRKFYRGIGGTYVYGNRFHDDFYRNELYCDVYNPVLVYILLFLCFHIYHYYLQLEDSKKIEKQLVLITHRNEINILKASIQPMFLLRSLTAIGNDIPVDYAHTKALIKKLIGIIHFSVNVSGKDYILLAEEIEFIKSYLSLEQERFKNKINVIYDISPDSLNISLPPMLIQPIVENAIKHGLEKNIGGGTIKLSVYISDKYLNICVSDTGKGIVDINDPLLFTKGIGLGNITQRIKYLFNEEIQLKSNDPGGLEVFYKIPYE